MGYESLHLQCPQVDDVIPKILSPAVYCGFGTCGSQGFTWWHYDVAEWAIELDFDVWSMLLFTCKVQTL